MPLYFTYLLLLHIFSWISFSVFIFPIDSNAFSCLQEALYYVVSRFDNNYFVVKLNEIHTLYNLYLNAEVSQPFYIHFFFRMVHVWTFI